ncbi:MAG: sulfite exporter TauE/SafE family protein [Proteobacteria bacterium]|nr:sulfite exporter TauE/SafE family protein [Pseudomonadota bacterium]
MVGGILGLIGGGGSILAVPLLVYVVGVQSPHVAIGTSAVAVALSAFSSLLGHMRLGNVKWPCALVFTGCGIAGAAIGSTIGKAFDGARLLFLFGILMMIVAGMMLMRRGGASAQFTPLTRDTARVVAPRLAGFGALTGMLAGFFGIGGGFLVVPGLIAATDMPIISAIGSSLVSVTAFGLTTAANYWTSGFIDWRLVVLFVIGGVVGSFAGGAAASKLATRKAALTRIFAGVVATVGLYMVVRGIGH